MYSFILVYVFAPALRHRTSAARSPRLCIAFGGLVSVSAGRPSLESIGPRTSRSIQPAQHRQDSGHVPVLPTALCVCLGDALRILGLLSCI